MACRKEIRLPSFGRGIHQITDIINRELATINEIPACGLVNIFLLHTSAALTITENFDRDVPLDISSFLDKQIPDSVTLYNHSDEGPDDMPAHIKSSLLGVSLNVPFKNNRLTLGTWQGIFLCEFRDIPSSRKILMTIFD